MTTRGHCLCKTITWAFEGAATWTCYCHCDDCRRNCAAPVVAWLGVPKDHFVWTGETPRHYESSPGVYRYFCGTCGSPVGFEADHYPGGMHLYVAQLDNPEQVAPQFHVNHSAKLPWLQLDDDLTSFDTTLLGTPNDPAGYT